MLYQYIVLYLEAVEMRNEPALKSLIRQNSSIKSTSHDESLNRRVSSLIELYPRYVISGKGSYRIIEMVPGFAAVEQQGLPPNGQTQLNRTVTFVESEGVIAVNEKFPQWLAPEDAILYHDDRPLFGSGQTNPRIESEREIPILGVPLDLVVLDDSDKDARLFRVVWPGLTVEAVGTCDVASLTFSGKVRQVSATYTQFRTGSGLKPVPPSMSFTSVIRSSASKVISFREERSSENALRPSRDRFHHAVDHHDRIVTFPKLTTILVALFGGIVCRANGQLCSG